MKIIQSTKPINFKKELVQENKIIHRGVFSPDLQEYYFTISDKTFINFDIFLIKRENNKWSQPQEAFINSQHKDHGMSFSPDGKSIYFSSTRPVGNTSVPMTWHLWKSDQKDGVWSQPVFIDIPNLRDKLVSHPSVSKSGTIFYHTSNLDYTEMNIYYSKFKDGKYKIGQKLKICNNLKTNYCTPFVSPDEDYLIFAEIGNQLDLLICFNNGNDEWINTKKLETAINNNGQGNPYVTPDNKCLFFATGNNLENWSIKCVSFEPHSLNN